MILLLPGLLLWMGYAWLIAFYLRGWRLSAAQSKFLPASPIPVTILVPARNEALRLPALLAALRQQQYPAEMMEVLVLDDHSEDDTCQVAAGQAPILSLPAGVEGKKAAIALGVAHARHELLLITDADCIPGPQWVAQMTACHQEYCSQFLAAPVRYRHPRGFCAVFQTLDFLTLQGITAASVATGFHSMCNGANLAYTRSAFQQVGGFQGIDRLASGDDLLLMHKIALQFPGQVHYLHSPLAMVDTDPAEGWLAFWKQRIRWASKSAHYNDRRIYRALLLLFCWNAFLLALFILTFLDAAYLPVFGLLLVLKTLTELRLLVPVARFFGQQHLLGWFPLLQPLHIVYTVLVGVCSQFGRYEWKGRRVR